jgi:very-short-patch-repair endonuclease
MREERVESPDRMAARVAARQHGVITTSQLYRAGIDKSAIARRVAAGRLHRVYQGVYAVGHAALSTEGRWTAAVLASGPGAVLSHRSAAELWQMLEPDDGSIHVTVPVAGGRAKRRGIRIHRHPSLTSAQTTARDGIPVTSPARTIEDLRRTERPWKIRRAIRQADFIGLPIGDHADRDRTRSELERRFLALCRHHHLPSPAVNVRLGRWTVDFMWREPMLIVETDGYGAHRGRQAFEDDRARDNDLAAMGYEVLRFSARRVRDEADAVAALIRTRLDG